MDGIFLFDKPQGFTSHDAVAKLRNAFRKGRVGHTGTLDPMATGVLPVCVGEATKIASFLAGDDKVYDAVLRQAGCYRARTTEEALDIAYAARPRCDASSTRPDLPHRTWSTRSS